MRKYGSYYILLTLVLATEVNAAALPSAVTVTVVPNAPSDLTATANAATQISLAWTNNSSAPVSIERKTGSGGIYVEIATTTSNIATFVDNGVAAATTYFYQVRSFIDANYSPYSNEVSATTPSGGGGGSGGGSGGGGGGGGSGYFPPPPVQTSAIFRGIAYPSSRITLLKNAQVVAVTPAGPDAKFEVDLANLTAGTYNFGVWADDPEGNRSITQTFAVTISQGATTIVSGIFFPPTIYADKVKVRQGDVLNILGYSAPQATISIVVHSNQDILKTTQAAGSGKWLYAFNTHALALGDHTARASAAASDGAVTSDSGLVAFTVGSENVAAPGPASCPPKGDLNGDCKVDLVDFSIMAYWYKRPNPPPVVDLDHNGMIDLVDFSILAYYWTG